MEALFLFMALKVTVPFALTYLFLDVSVINIFFLSLRSQFSCHHLSQAVAELPRIAKLHLYDHSVMLFHLTLQYSVMLSEAIWTIIFVTWFSFQLG